MALTDYKASEIYSGFDISSLSDRPNEDGLTSAQLKARFDYLIKNMIPLHNALINALIVLLEQGNETNGHKHNVDNLIDGTTNRLFTETLKLKLDGIQAQAEVNQNAFSNIKVGGSTGNADSKTATFEIVAGLNIVASIDPLTNKVTLSATGDISTLAVQSILDDIGNYYNSIEVNGALQEIGAILYPSIAKTTPVNADTILISDSASSGVFKKLSWASIKATLKTYFDTVYQGILVSGTNIKSINGSSILGSGNLALENSIQLALSDETTAITTGTGKLTFRMPYACKFTKIPRINLNTVSSSGLVTVDIKKNGTTIFSTLLTIDANEKTSVTAATPCVLSSNPTTFADDDEISFDITVAGTGAKGLKATLFVEKV